MQSKAQKIRKWLLVLASSGFLLQATPGGCPNGAALKGAASTGIQSVITGILGAYVKTSVNQIFGVSTST
jgi:hypothetical protein